MKNYKLKNEKSQVKVEKELKKKFLPKKQDSILLSQSYARLSCSYYNDGDIYKSDKYLKKADRVSECGTLLEFGRTSEDEYKLHNANFCRDRLCPMCSWRRSYKIFGQISKIMDVIDHDYRFLFLTLTVPNCYGWELAKKIDKMQKAFTRFSDRNKLFKKSVCGYFKALEITHDTEPLVTAKRYKKSPSYYHNFGLCVGDVNPNYNTYHPHFHCILAVEPSYFQKNYISHDTWLSMWQSAMQDYSITQVDIRICKPKGKLSSAETSSYKKLSSAVCEVAKYSVKSHDYIVNDDALMTDMSVDNLSDALGGRRLCSLGGVFRKTLQQLRLDDMEDGDLVNIDCNAIRNDVFVQLLRYEWTAGLYKLTDIIDL